MMALVIPILAACGGGGTGGGGATPAAGGGATAAPAEGGAATAAPAEGGGATAAPAEGGAAAGGTIDFSVLEVEEGAQLRFQAAANETEQQLYNQGAERFNEVFAGRNVQMTFEPTAGDYNTLLQAAFAGGNEPDVFLINGALMGTLAPEGLLLPLDEAMTQSGVQATDFYDPLIQLYQADGATYGIPKDFNPLVLFINTDMAQEAGVDPASIQTWDDLKTAAEQMTKGEGAAKQYGVCLNPDIERYGASMFQKGNPIIENNKAVFNNAEGVEAIQFWYDFKTAGTGALFADLGKDWCGAAFASRNVAMVVEGGWIVPFLANPSNGATDLEYTAVPLPTPEGGEQGTWLFTNAFAASANTQYPKAAAAAVLFLTSEVNQRELIPTGLAQPSLKSLVDDPFYQENEVAKVLIEAGEYGRLSDTTFGGPLKLAEVRTKINEAMQRIFRGEQSVQDALNQAASEVDPILSEQ
jgi:multiple sugar transport system substrate-binding protein